LDVRRKILENNFSALKELFTKFFEKKKSKSRDLNYFFKNSILLKVFFVYRR
jgi:hypothetical protein